MTNDEVFRRLDTTGIRIVRDSEVPINGVVQPLPYMAALPKTTLIGSDNGLVGLQKNDWQLALMTADRDDGLNKRILAALKGCGKVTMEHFPDLKPYQTTFKFTTFDR